MLKVKELEKLSGSLKLSEFRKQLGPFALIQRPPEGTALPKPAHSGVSTNPWGVDTDSTRIAKPGAVDAGTLALLFQFDTLVVATLPPLKGVDELSVGRQPDCDLVIAEASVSKSHAVLRWDAKEARATVQDVGSRNGTFVNAGARVEGERKLKDGDIVSFGEVQFWFLLIETLYAKLAQAKMHQYHGV